MDPRSHPLRLGPVVTSPPLDGPFLSTTHPFRPPPVAVPPLDWWRSIKKGTLACSSPQFPLLLLFGVAHTLFPLWTSCGSRGVCVGVPLYSQKFIHILGDLGVGVKLASSLFYQWMRRTASRRPFSVLPIDSSVQVWGAPLCSCKGRTAV